MVLLSCFSAKNHEVLLAWVLHLEGSSLFLPVENTSDLEGELVAVLHHVVPEDFLKGEKMVISTQKTLEPVMS
jgi:hypothetical protein